MPKYRRIRRYRRRSGKWAPSIVKVSNQLTASTGEWYQYEELCTNPVQVVTGVAQTFTVKNFEITFTLETSYTEDLESITAYIMYVPQGMSISATYFQDHPEYIMAYKYLGSPTSKYYVSAGSGSFNQFENQNFQPTRIRTRLSRKLQTGDSIILYLQGSNESSSNKTFKLDGIIRWWSKAN